MGSRLSRLILALTCFAVLTTMAGCSSDQYFMVPKHGLENITESVNTQRATLVTMESNSANRHTQLLEINQQSTQSILQAIATQVEKPSCPAPEETQDCAATEQPPSDRINGKLVVGELEKLYLAGPGLVYDARIDSGAQTSSVYARNTQQFERDGNNWVRFEVPIPGDDDNWASMEKEISRQVRIVQASSDDAERRIVVSLQFAIGNHQQVAEFTLADRENLTYDVLIGRNILRDVMLIDVGKEFATTLPDSYFDEPASETSE